MPASQNFAKGGMTGVMLFLPWKVKSSGHETKPLQQPISQSRIAVDSNRNDHSILDHRADSYCEMDISN